MNNNEKGFNKIVLVEQLIVTFVIMAIFWIPCIVLGVNGITMKEHYCLYIPWFLGGISPAIASFLVLKKNKEVSGFIDWIKQVFDFKHNAWEYILSITLPIVQMVLMCFISGYKKGLALYYLPLMILAMVFAGGLEETGWRYVIHTELNKKFGFIISVLITAVIWWIWHLPLFFIPGTSQYGKDFFVFGIMILGFSFMVAIIRELTGSVWLCILCHAIVNSLGNFFHYDVYGNYLASSITTIVLIAISLILLYVFKYRNKKQES